MLALIAATAVNARDGSKLGTYFAVIPFIWVAEIILWLAAARAVPVCGARRDAPVM